MMPWIESHTELARHPKTIRLAKQLNISVRESIGLLHLLWWWALEYAPDGDLSRFEDDEIAAAVLWEGDGSAVRRALQSARFLDADEQLHDWEDYAGRLIERRQENAQRMREARARHAPSINKARAQNVDNTCAERATLPYPTVPDPTNRTVPDQETHTAVSTADPARAAPSDVQEIFDHYQRWIQPAARICPDQRIKTRLRRFSIAELKRAVENFALDEWQMQNNRTRGAPWFFKSDERVEQYVNLIPRQERSNGTSREQRNGSVSANGRAPGASGARAGASGKPGISAERLAAYRGDGSASAGAPGQSGVAAAPLHAGSATDNHPAGGP